MPAEQAKPSLSDTGQGAVRQAALSNAQHVIDGDVVGRDKFVFLMGGEKKAALRRLSPLLYERVQNAFVDPDNWGLLREQFGKRRIVILRGGPGQGRTAMAVRLMMSAGTDAIYDLDARIDLNRLVEQLTREGGGSTTVGDGSGFLLNQPHTATLRGRTLRDLDDVLAATSGRLVLTVGPDALLADEELMEYLIELPAAPDHRRIVERHLEWRLDSGSARRLLTDEQVSAVIDEILAEVVTCQAVATLAFVISDEPSEGISVERVRRRMGELDRDAFGTWFDELRDVRVRSFAIALAALDGLPYEDIARAAEKLRRRLDPPAAAVVESAPGKAPDRQRHFHFPRRQLLEQVRATLVETEIRQGYGWVPAQAVSYKDRSYARQVIAYVWQEHQIHDILLDWLIELVEEPSEPVVVQVATTLGVLATYSFHHIRTSVLWSWAGSTDPWKREAVAYALRVPAADPRLAGTVSNLVDLWFGDEADQELQATAVRALGVRLAGDDAAASVARLERVACEASWTVTAAIASTFSDLITNDERRFTPIVLGTLLQWFDHRERADTARLAFLMLSHDLVSERPPAVPGRPLVRWPDLLRLALESPVVLDLLVRGWCLALSEGTWGYIAENVLDGWAGLAERDDQLLDAFTRLVRAIGRTDARARTMLLHSALRWRDDAMIVPLLRAAAAVDTVLAH